LTTYDADFIVYARGRVETAEEGDAVSFSIIRAGDDDANFTVNWSLSGDGIDAGDVDGPLSGAVEFQAGGSNLRTVTIDLALDSLVEPSEDLTITLGDITFTAATDLVGEIGTAEATTTILDGGIVGDGRVQGTPGRDTVQGRSGDDFLFGLAGPDLLRGREGEDTLVGGGGPDTLEGGPGQDIFATVLGDTASTDTILDFGPGDRLAFDDRLFGLGDGGIDARPLTSEDFAFIRSLGTVGYRRDRGEDETVISYDSDGPRGPAPLAPIVVLEGAPAITLDDVLLF
jgi:Ca2+-binding RTX toxin-like protein